jgi:hypothetical protein
MEVNTLAGEAASKLIQLCPQALFKIHVGIKGGMPTPHALNGNGISSKKGDKCQAGPFQIYYLCRFHLPYAS